MFLLMTDGAWHCQGTVGQAFASSMPPAPLLCTPSTQTQTCARSLAFSLGLSLSNSGAPLPLSHPTHARTSFACLPLNHPPSVCLTHKRTGILLFLLCPLRGCLWTDIRGAGRTLRMNPACAGIEHTRHIICYTITIQDESINSLLFGVKRSVLVSYERSVLSDDRV